MNRSELKLTIIFIGMLLFILGTFTHEWFSDISSFYGLGLIHGPIALDLLSSNNQEVRK